MQLPALPGPEENQLSIASRIALELMNGRDAKEKMRAVTTVALL